MQDADEAELVRLAKRGNESAIEALILRQQGRVRAFLAVRLHDASQVDDLAQDAFVIVCDRLATFDESMPFFPWVRGIAHNVLRNHLRKQYAFATDPDEVTKAIDATVADRADDLGDHDHHLLLRRCLDELGGNAAATIRAHYFDDRSLATIGAEQGRSAKAVAALLVRTRKWLRDCLHVRIQAMGGEA